MDVGDDQRDLDRLPVARIAQVEAHGLAEGRVPRDAAVVVRLGGKETKRLFHGVSGRDALRTFGRRLHVVVREVVDQ